MNVDMGLWGDPWETAYQFARWLSAKRGIRFRVVGIKGPDGHWYYYVRELP